MQQKKKQLRRKCVMKKSSFLKRVLDGCIIASMVVIVISILVQFGFKPEGQLFVYLFHMAVVVLVALMIINIIGNNKAISRERVPWLLINIVSLVVLVLTILGLKFWGFEKQTFAVISSYVALVMYCFSGLCLL